MIPKKIFSDFEVGTYRGITTETQGDLKLPELSSSAQRRQVPTPTADNFVVFITPHLLGHIFVHIDALDLNIISFKCWVKKEDDKWQYESRHAYQIGGSEADKGHKATLKSEYIFIPKWIYKSVLDIGPGFKGSDVCESGDTLRLGEEDWLYESPPVKAPSSWFFFLSPAAIARPLHDDYSIPPLPHKEKKLLDFKCHYKEEDSKWLTEITYTVEKSKELLEFSINYVMIPKDIYEFEIVFGNWFVEFFKNFLKQLLSWFSFLFSK